MSEMATSQEKKEWILFIDGKKWISKNLEKGIEDSEYVMMGVEDPNEILGFSNKETFKKFYRKIITEIVKEILQQKEIDKQNKQDKQ